MSVSEHSPVRVPALARPGLWLALLLLVTALLHVGHALAAAHDPYLRFHVGDEAFYDEWARRIAGGALVRSEPFFTTPLFAYWLAALYRLGSSSIAAVQIANAALGVAAVAFTWAAARRLAGPVAALVAGALVALSRSLLVYESAPDKTALVLCLASLAIAAATWAEEKPLARRWALAGAAAGAAALAHVLVLMLVPAVLVHLAVNGGVRRAARTGAAYVAGALLALAPATFHNAVAGKELILVCSNGGHNLYLGNHAGNLTGLYTSPPFSRANLAYEQASFRDEAERRAGHALSAGGVSSFWTREALREMAATPGLTAVRFVRKLRWSVNQEEIADSRTYRFYAGRLTSTRYLLWDFGLPAVLGLVAAIAFLRERRLALIVGFTALYAAALGMFFVYGRYRLPLVVPLAILAGALVARARSLVRELRGFRLAAVLTACVVAPVAVFGRVLPGVEESFFPDFYNQGNHYLDEGRTDEALVEYEKAITVKPGDHPALAEVAMQLARMHLARGDRRAAARVLSEAARVRPREASLRHALAALEW